MPPPLSSYYLGLCAFFHLSLSHEQFIIQLATLDFHFAVIWFDWLLMEFFFRHRDSVKMDFGFSGQNNISDIRKMYESKNQKYTAQCSEKKNYCKHYYKWLSTNCHRVNRGKRTVKMIFFLSSVIDKSHSQQ